MKSLYLIVILIFSYIFNTNYSYSDIKITSLKENVNIFSLLKDYKIYTNNCEKFLDRYNVIEGIEYFDFNNNLKQDGTIVVLDTLTDSVISIFNELKNIHFNINIIHPTAVYKKNWYGGIDVPDDFNGTESFVCRNVEHTNRPSLHSYGTALDINFLQNPCIFIDWDKNEIQNVVPKAGIKYLNRYFNRKGKEEKDIGKVNKEVVDIFRKYGYDVWGGYWDFPIDYQHFQVSTKEFAQILMFANKKDAKKIFKKHIKCINYTNKSLIEIANENNFNLLEEYKKNRTDFFKKIDIFCK